MLLARLRFQPKGLEDLTADTTCFIHFIWAARYSACGVSQPNRCVTHLCNPTQCVSGIRTAHDEEFEGTRRGK